ncbi:MAG: hypothetical protein DWQ02_06695 [Bacteroidetes bacterium]|nr:MAG: hypothetical protein DWQ02_06695 [Bacteroidota bacterium]
MNFKPNNFYIGIIDLFAIILPGAIATLVIYPFWQKEIDLFLESSGNKDFYSAFRLILSSYLLVHIISQISSYLDRSVYDRLKNNRFKNDSRLNAVKEIRKASYNHNLKNSLLNTFSWANFKLIKELPLAAEEIERYTADSKFFRGLFVILFLLIFVFAQKGNWGMSVVCFLLAAFSMVRYFRKRRKATETAYKYVIFLEKLNKKKIKPTSQGKLLAILKLDDLPEDSGNITVKLK